MWNSGDTWAGMDEYELIHLYAFASRSNCCYGRSLILLPLDGIQEFLDQGMIARLVGYIVGIQGITHYYTYDTLCARKDDSFIAPASESKTGSNSSQSGAQIALRLGAPHARSCIVTISCIARGLWVLRRAASYTIIFSYGYQVY